jgi:neutral ceramidase
MRSLSWRASVLVLVCGLVTCLQREQKSQAEPRRSEARGLAADCTGQERFLIGTGVHDVTGPAAEVGMMGYGKAEQTTVGIHQRLRSRAFVIASPCNGKRVVVVSADLGFIFQGVKQQVVERLRATFGPLYTDENVLLSATHTHSGPGGYSHYALYNLTTLGFDPQNFQAVVEGIYQSILRAHAHLAEGSIHLAAGELRGASRNRSPEAYRLNPAEERARYGQDVDTRMTLLRFTRPSGLDVGLINWFAVHCTSMGNTHGYIHSDNKGHAAYLFEKDGAAAGVRRAGPGAGGGKARAARAHAPGLAPRADAPAARGDVRLHALLRGLWGRGGGRARALHARGAGARHLLERAPEE